jgi:hypothetical protein
VRGSGGPTVDDTEGTALRGRRAGTASLLSVHKLVDDLCATALDLCADGGNAGDSATGRNQNRAFTWESTTNILCIKKKREFSTCHTGINDELAERLSQVYTVVIYRREGENIDLRDGEPGRFWKGSQAQPGIHQALADGSPASSQSAASARSEPGPPGTRSAALSDSPLRPLHLGGVASGTALTQAQREA